MKTKKIISTLVVVGIIGVAFIGYKAYAKLDNGKNLKQDVVYTVSNVSEEESDTFILNSDELKDYSELSKQVLKRYFDVDDFNGLTFNAQRVNEKTIDAIHEEVKKNLKKSYENKEINQYDYEKIAERFYGEGDNAFEADKKALKEAGYSKIMVSWSGERKNFNITFNESTNEIVDVRGNCLKEWEGRMNSSEEELRRISETFIKDKQLCNLENLNFEEIKEDQHKDQNDQVTATDWRVIYNDKKNNSKKVVIIINDNTAIVEGFELI